MPTHQTVSKETHLFSAGRNQTQLRRDVRGAWRCGGCRSAKNYGVCQFSQWSRCTEKNTRGPHSASPGLNGLRSDTCAPGHEPFLALLHAVGSKADPLPKLDLFFVHSCSQVTLPICLPRNPLYTRPALAKRVVSVNCTGRCSESTQERGLSSQQN